jgi:hypothetical protein
VAAPAPRRCRRPGPGSGPAPLRDLARPAPGAGSRRDPTDHPGRTPLRRRQILQATAFLAWLAGRGRTLAACTQADVDTWHVEHTASDRANLRAFLQWSAKTRLSPRFALPATARRGGTPLPERDRTALLGQVLTDHHAPLHSRAAAAILLLYARPCSRITRLTIDDVIHDGDQILLRLGDPPSPMPAPVAALLLEHLAQGTT